MHDLNENRSGYHKTKVGWLPNDWDCAAFGQIARRVSKPVAVAKGEYYREIGLRSHGRGVFHKDPVPGADLGEKRVFRVQPGALIFNIVFAWEQAVAMTSEAEAGMIASHRFPMFVGRDGKAAATFLLRYFLTPRGKHELGLASPGGAGRNKTLGQDDLTRLPVPLPPLAEQRRIVEVLATWDAALRDVEALIAAQGRRKAGLMQQLLGGHTRLPGFTGEWREARLCDLAQVNRQSLTAGTPAEYSFWYLDISGVKAGSVDWPPERTSFGDAPSRARRVTRSGDVLLSTVRPRLGGHAFLRSIPEDVVCSTGFAVLSPRPGADGQFLFQVLFSTGMVRQFDACICGSNYPALTDTDVRRLRFPAPPLPEQRAIAAVLGVADEELQALEEEHAALERQRRGLMQQLLSGALRVSPGQGPDSYSAQPERLGSGTVRGS